jgi:hypothetical protein
MANLIHSMLSSVDSYTEDERGRFGWDVPEDEEVHSYINQLASSSGGRQTGKCDFGMIGDKSALHRH